MNAIIKKAAVVLLLVGAVHAEQKIGTHKDAACLAASKDGTLVATGGWDKVARIFPASGGSEKKLEGHKGAVLAVAFSPDAKTLATGSDDKTAKLWDTATGKVKLEVAAGASVEGVAFSPDGSLLALALGDMSARIVDASSGKILRKLEGHKRTVRSVAFSPDGKHLVTASGDETIKVWDATTGACERSHDEAHAGRITAAHFLDDEKVVSGANDKAVRFWGKAPAAERSVDAEESINALALSPDRKLVAAGTMKDIVLIPLGQDPKRLDPGGANVRGLAFLDGKRLACVTSDGAVRVVAVP